MCPVLCPFIRGRVHLPLDLCLVIGMAYHYPVILGCPQENVDRQRSVCEGTGTPTCAAKYLSEHLLGHFVCLEDGLQ